MFTGIDTSTKAYLSSQGYTTVPDLGDYIVRDGVINCIIEIDTHEDDGSGLSDRWVLYTDKITEDEYYNEQS